MRTLSRLWLGIIILILLSPLGLFLPEHFRGGDAWGEWGTDSIKELIGYIPQGLERLSNIWKAPLPDYAFKGWEEKGLGSLSFSYIISAAVGIAVIVAAVMIIGRFLAKKGD